MATISHHALLECDGFSVETPDGPIGWVEEAWLGPDDEPAALALHLVDGRRGLLLADDVEAVLPGRERVHARDGARSQDWRPIALLLPALALLIALEIALAFTVAYLVTGRAY